MLKHCVFVNFRTNVAAEDRERVLSGFGTLLDEVDGMIDYSHGPNLDFEQKSQAYDSGFVITFADRAAHLAYEQHPKHVALGGELVAMCEGGHNGIIVFDLQVV